MDYEYFLFKDKEKRNSYVLVVAGDNEKPNIKKGWIASYYPDKIIDGHRLIVELTRGNDAVVGIIPRKEETPDTIYLVARREAIKSAKKEGCSITDMTNKWKRLNLPKRKVFRETADHAIRRMDLEIRAGD